MHRYTHIVVGAGTAGCLLACRLADASADHRVLLIDGGGSDRGLPWFQIPVGYLACIGNPRADWMYTTQPCDALNGRSLKYPRGKVLGGCSSINGMIYARGQKRDYDGWASRLNDDAWSWDALLPFFKKHEANWRVRDAASTRAAAATHHGFEGELYVDKQRLHWPVLDDLQLAASEALALPIIDDFNTGNNEGVGYFEVTQRNGRRWSSASAFLFAPPRRAETAFWRSWLPALPTLTEILFEGLSNIRMHRRPVGLHPAPRRPNLTIALGHTVDTVLLSGTHNRCTGVEAVLPSTAARARFELVTDAPNAEVILAAGAIGTPAILMRSGVGPEPELRRLGVPVKSCLNGVGANLQDHLQIRTVFQLTSPQAKGVTLNTKLRNPLELIKMAKDFSLHGWGPLTMAPSQLGCFARSNANEQLHPNVEFHIQPLSLPAFGEPLDEFDAVTISVCNLNPTSTGTVTLASTDPYAAPIIQPNYLATEADRQRAVESVALARRVAAHAGFVAKYRPIELKPGPDCSEPAAVLRAVGDISSTIFHPSCTCKMGLESDAMAVLTPRLQVRSTEGLRVCDASAMPCITSGNTNEPTLVIAERLAEWMTGGVSR